MADEKKKKTPVWVTVIGAAFAGGLFASMATVATGYLTFSNKDRELDLQLIDISLGILRGENEVEDANDEGIVAARRFAVLTITRLAGTPIKDQDVEAWAKGAVTPFKEVESPEARELRTTRSITSNFKEINKRLIGLSAAANSAADTTPPEVYHRISQWRTIVNGLADKYWSTGLTLREQRQLKRILSFLPRNIDDLVLGNISFEEYRLEAYQAGQPDTP